MPLVMDKQRRKSAVKRSKADQEASKAYTGVKKEKEDMYAFRRGVQVGVVMGDDTGIFVKENVSVGKQGMILESVPTTVQNVKVLLDGEKSMKVFTKAQLLLLSDLVKIQSFNDIYGRKESTQRSRSREPSYRVTQFPPNTDLQVIMNLRLVITGHLVVIVDILIIILIVIVNPVSNKHFIPILHHSLLIESQLFELSSETCTRTQHFSQYLLTSLLPSDSMLMVLWANP